jgi:hypothetical protein
MSLGSLMHRWFRDSFNRPIKRTPIRRDRLTIEPLEDRVVLNVGAADATHVVTGLFYDLMGRQPSRAEVNAWVNVLARGIATIPQAAEAFVHTPEYEGNWLAGKYQTILGRQGDPAGMAGWVAAMQQGVTQQDVISAFLLSPEFLSRVGPTNEGWVTGLYRNLLGRQPDAPSLAIWVNYIESGFLSASAVEGAIQRSPEALAFDVSNTYHSVLGRSAAPAEINGWAAALASGLSLEELAAIFASSPEYISQQLGVDLPLSDGNSFHHYPPPIANLHHPSANNFGTVGATVGGSDVTAPASGAGVTALTPVTGHPGTPPGAPPPAPVQLVNGTWVPVGPAPIKNGQVADNGPVTGRIDGIAADPTNANIIYIGAAGGGIWKTIDGGQTWTAMTNDSAEENIVIGAIAISPSNPNILYAGTGEADNSADSYYGAGVLKSTDAGATWALMGSTPFNQKGITKIAIDPTNPDTVYVATADAFFGSDVARLGGNGIWKTTDGGTTWTNTTTSISASAQDDEYTDVTIAVPPTSTTPATLFMAIGNDAGSNDNFVYESTDGATTWKKAGNYPGGGGVIRVAVAPSNPMILYSAASSPNNSNFGSLLFMEKSGDGGMTWSKLSPPDYMNEFGNFGQGDYDSTLIVDPKDPKTVYAGGAGGQIGTSDFVGSKFIASVDGGTTWVDASGIAQSKSPNGPHADHHAIAFDAAGKLLVGNDGGIWRLESLDTTTTPATATWTDLNGNLQITTFVGIALDPSNPQVAYGGSQDNGREKFTGDTAWNLVNGGDGGFIRVDPNKTQTVYGEFTGVSLQRSDDQGMTWNDKITGIGNDPANFYVPFIVDGSSVDQTSGFSRLLLGTNRIYESTNGGDSWHTLSQPQQNGWTTTAPVTAIAAATGDPNTIYATTNDGKIFVTTNKGTSWTERDLPITNDVRLPDIITDPADPKTAYVVRNAFTGERVFKTTNNAQTWTDITANMPPVPLNAIAIDKRPDHLNTLYVGTDGGEQGSVLALTTADVNWAALGTGLPNVRVTGLEVDETHDILAAGTYGLGMWEFTYKGGGGGTPTLSINDVTGARPLPGATAPLTFTVTLSAAPTQAVTVDFATQDDTAHANVDYVPNSGTLTFAAGDNTPQTITVQLIGSSDMSTKDFFVDLSNPVNATIAKAQGTGTITPLLGTMAINDVLQPRPPSGTIPFNFTVSLNPAPSQVVTVNFATQDNTAVANVDYQPASGTLTFQPGQTSQTIPVTVIGSTDLNTKVFFVNLSNATSGVAVIKAQGVGTILSFNALKQPDQFDPNDSSDQAHDFGIFPAGMRTFTQLSIFNEADGLPNVDWYRAIAGQDGVFSVAIDYLMFQGSDLHLRLFALDSAGVLHQLDSSRNMNTNHQIVSAVVSAGETVLVWVYGFNHAQGIYDMTLSLG